MKSFLKIARRASGVGWQSGPRARVIRGGSWTAFPLRCRSSKPNAGSGSNRDRGVGIRGVCEAE